MNIVQTISAYRSHLMGIAMLAIMLFHQSWIWGKGLFYVPFVFFHVYGNWGVDIFFFVSGFGLYFSLKKNDSPCSFFVRRLIRLFPLCIACGLLRYIVDHILPVGVGGYPTGNHEISTNWVTILSWDKWFITVILVYYLLMPFLYRIINRYGKSLLWGVYFLWAFSFLLMTYDLMPSFVFYDYVMRLPSFCLGAIIASGCVIYSKPKLFLGIIPIVFAMIYKFLMMSGIIEDGSVRDSFNFLLLSFGITPVCFLLSKIFSKFDDNSTGIFILEGLKYLGKHSLELYLIHEFVYRYTYRFLIETSLPLFIQMLIGVVASVLFAINISFVVNRCVNFFLVSKY